MKLTKTDGQEIKISSRKRDIARVKILRQGNGINVSFKSQPITKQLIREADGRYSPKICFESDGTGKETRTYNLSTFLNDCCTSNSYEIQHVAKCFQFNMKELAYDWNYNDNTCIPNLSFMAIVHKPQDYVNTTFIGTFSERQFEIFTDMVNDYIQKLWKKWCYTKSTESIISVSSVTKKDHD